MHYSGSLGLTINSSFGAKTSAHGFGLLKKCLHSKELLHNSLLLPPDSPCSWEQAIPRILLRITLSHPNNTEIYNPNEISSCQPEKESCSHQILPDHSHSLFLSIIVDFRMAILLSIYTQSKRLLANSKHIISPILSCAIHLPLQWEPKRVLQKRIISAIEKVT